MKPLPVTDKFFLEDPKNWLDKCEADLGRLVAISVNHLGKG